MALTAVKIPEPTSHPVPDGYSRYQREWINKGDFFDRQQRRRAR
jgi:hypothetical protein